MDLLVNIDVPDLERAIAFYTEAFGLSVSRMLGQDGAELTGWPTRLYLLKQPEGSLGAAASPRTYRRHWTPVHLDVVVPDIGGALDRAIGAGATLASGLRIAAWGKIATLADPFGHGLCLVEFIGRGYDELASTRIVTPSAQAPATHAG